MHASIHYLLGKPRIKCGKLNTCEFVWGTMSRAKLSLHLSVLHYQMTFEWYSGRGSDFRLYDGSDLKDLSIDEMVGV